MPKVVKTAAEILGTEKVPQAPAAEPAPAAETQPTTPPTPVKIADPVAPAPAVPPAGFETPPSEPAVEEVGVSGLPVTTPPPAAPAASAPESLLSQARSKRAEVPAPVEPAPAPAVVDPNAPKEHRFVKNVHPGEIITFEDGTTFKFPGTVFVTKDPVLAAKILAVASRHHIVQ